MNSKECTPPPPTLSVFLYCHMRWNRSATLFLLLFSSCFEQNAISCGVLQCCCEPRLDRLVNANVVREPENVLSGINNVSYNANRWTARLSLLVFPILPSWATPCLWLRIMMFMIANYDLVLKLILFSLCIIEPTIFYFIRVEFYGRLITSQSSSIVSSIGLCVYIASD